MLRRYGDAQERYATLDGWGFTALVDEVRRHLDIDHIDERTPLRRLSGGEQARTMLAGVLLARPTVLLLDEPTNHLDLAGLRWLETYLAGFPGAVMVVSHDRRFLDNTVARIFELDGIATSCRPMTVATRPTGRRSCGGGSGCSRSIAPRSAIASGSRPTSPAPASRRSAWSAPPRGPARIS